MRQIFHHWEAWECVPAGMYDTAPPSGMDASKCKESYCVFLADIGKFEDAMSRVIKEWPVSCEQFLSNENINRLAWLGQASMCISEGVPAAFRSGFTLLSHHEQALANTSAQRCLDAWLHRDEPYQLELPSE